MKRNCTISQLLLRSILIMMLVITVVIVMITGQKGALPEANASDISTASSSGSLSASASSHSVNRAAAPVSLDAVGTGVPTFERSIAKTSVAKKSSNEKIVYLTFDDGPSKLTDQVLDILKKENAAATFFVLGEHAKHSPEVIYRIVDAGHAIGNHSFDHKYDDLYSSFTHFWGQIKATEEVLKEIIGVRPELVRAPGGTYGHFDETYFNLLEQGGYKVFDWDVDSGDSKRRGVPASEIVKNVTSTKLKNEMIVLMHDGTGHAETVKALPEIIKFYKKHGYTFRALSTEQSPVQFHISPSVKNKGRNSPSLAWVQKNVVPNADLFGPGQSLVLEAAGVETRLDPGEYSLRNGQYQVPIRTVMERLGAQVKWDQSNRTAVIVWGDVRIIIDTKRETITGEQGESSARKGPVAINHDKSSLWIPLRTLLESSGQTIVSVAASQKERRVKAQ
ncbi:Peptidoglycan/xylan/chitin deacetylase, PgdA/CDA1 family [Fontibacillus panacisegetis]|uniref:Peptidoglycan/xylan/chitin deacetylase, PgdA/CDA1 family n=1 Tax=Fontibacillus panacisegetis TaxID=670482 RepID=A0A1G7QGG3_9BACL|nr:polysaccharide deacetylase [Fontibacillus panacisegetis]SDF97582.1 Peptidoglycan/xylan/chitin deacetylase, PgdA/CDA1 family [Fontibacillus panacisegetis]